MSHFLPLRSPGVSSLMVERWLAQTSETFLTYSLCGAERIPLICSILCVFLLQLI